MSGASDRDVTEAVLGDSFHRGLAEHGEFQGFDRKVKPEGMTDEESTIMNCPQVSSRVYRKKEHHEQT